MNGSSGSSNGGRDRLSAEHSVSSVACGLPLELLHRVLGYLCEDLPSIFNVLLVSQHWHKASRDESLWRRLGELRWASIEGHREHFATKEVAARPAGGQGGGDISENTDSEVAAERRAKDRFLGRAFGSALQGAETVCTLLVAIVFP